jgi:hypothetical protein
MLPEKHSTQKSPVGVNRNPNIYPGGEFAPALHRPSSRLELSAPIDAKKSESKAPDTVSTNGKHMTTYLGDIGLNVKMTISMPGNGGFAPASNRQEKVFDTVVHSPRVDCEPEGSTVSTCKENRHHNLGPEVIRINQNDLGGSLMLDMKDVSSVEDVVVNTELRQSPICNGDSEVTHLTSEAMDELVKSNGCVSTASSTENNGAMPADLGTVDLTPSDSDISNHPSSYVKDRTTSKHISASTSEEHFTSENEAGIKTPQSDSSERLTQIPLNYSTLPLAQNAQLDNHQVGPTSAPQHSDKLLVSEVNPIVDVHDLTSTRNGTVPHLAVDPTNVKDNLEAPLCVQNSEEPLSNSNNSVHSHSVLPTLETSKPNQLAGYQASPKKAPTPYMCSLCHATCFATLNTPLVLCSGCGPLSKIRYCSVGCLLANAFDHAYHCMNFPASQRLAFHNLPPQYVYVTDPIMAIDPWIVISAELFRQKAFSMYERLGLSPTTFELARGRKDLKESVLSRNKVSGDYHVFRSTTTAAEHVDNLTSEIIFVSQRQYDCKLGMLN